MEKSEVQNLMQRPPCHYRPFDKAFLLGNFDQTDALSHIEVRTSKQAIFEVRTSFFLISFQFWSRTQPPLVENL